MRTLFSIALPFALLGDGAAYACSGACGKTDYRVSIVGFVLIVAAVIYSRLRGPDDRNGLRFDKTDPAMEAAMSTARQTLPQFWSRFGSPEPHDADFALKFNLTPDSPDGEHIWADDLARQGGQLFGTLRNEPVDGRYRIGQRVAIDPSQISDWSFFENGVAQGHFTTRVMLDRASRRQRKDQMAMMGWA